MSLFGLVTLLCLMKGVDGYPNGLVTDSCHTMLPNHDPYTPQTSKPPYTVSVTSAYTPSRNLTVTLEAIGSGTVFKGFLLQARQVGQHYAVGKFVTVDARAQTITCNNVANSSVSHVSPQNITRLQVTWLAPNITYLGDVMFCVTFVRDYDEFWVSMNSPVISLSTPVSSSSYELVRNFRQNSYYCLFAMIGITALLDFFN